VGEGDSTHAGVPAHGSARLRGAVEGRPVQRDRGGPARSSVMLTGMCCTACHRRRFAYRPVPRSLALDPHGDRADLKGIGGSEVGGTYDVPLW